MCIQWGFLLLGCFGGEWSGWGAFYLRGKCEKGEKDKRRPHNKIGSRVALCINLNQKREGKVMAFCLRERRKLMINGEDSDEAKLQNKQKESTSESKIKRTKQWFSGPLWPHYHSQSLYQWMLLKNIYFLTK